jgi:Fic family protein
MNRPKLDVEEEMELIKKALAVFEEGASIRQLKKITGLNIELRTLQRRLDILKKLGVVQSTGNRRSMKYHLAQPKEVRTVEETFPSEDDSLPLSSAAKEIRTLASLPEIQRLPVGYNRAFLESYRPNIDSYLTASERKRLAKIGKTTKDDQPAGTYAREILNRLLIDLSWNSSRLEGNTYSLLDTERLIALGEAADNKSAMEAQMILNHKEAIEFIVQDAEEIGLNRYTILNLHALLSNHLLPNPAASGRLRNFGVGITGSVFVPLAMPQLIENMFELLLSKAEQINDPFEQAFFVMVHLPYLQPFDDVNKRVSRLAANIPLNRHNLAPLSFIDVPADLYTQGMLGVYELNRIELLRDTFLWAYERSALRYAAIRQSLGEPDPFRLKYREEMRTLVAEIVSGALERKQAAILIHQKSGKLPAADRYRFIEMVETELLSLHEGNFARYHVRPSEFQNWKAVWGERKFD